MIDYVLYLLIYALGFLTGMAALMLIACWKDIVVWFDNLLWKIKTGRFR